MFAQLHVNEESIYRVIAIKNKRTEAIIADLDQPNVHSSMAQMVARGAHNPEVTRSRRVAAMRSFYYFYATTLALDLI